MSYVSIFKNIPDFLSQPTGIAAIASIGIHGAIAFILPLMPVESKPKTVASSKSVGLVELSQSEQQRLPKTSVAPKVALQPQIPLPNINSTLPNQQPLLPPLPPGSSTSLILPPLPKSTYKYPTYSLPKRSSLELFPGNRFNTGKTAYRPRINSIPKRKISPPRNRAVNYGNRGKWRVADPAATIAGINANGNPGTSRSRNTAKNNPPKQQLVAPVKSAFQSEGNYSIAATGGFQKFQPQSPQSSTNGNAIASPSPSPGKEIAALNSYQDLRQSVRRAYPGIEEKSVIRQAVATDKVALQGNVTGMLVVDAEGKVRDVVFLSDKSISPAHKVAIRKHFLKNPPPASKNLASYPFSLRLYNNSNVAADKIQPGVTPTKNQSLEQKLRRARNQQAPSSNQPVKIKNPVQVTPSTNSNNQQAPSSNQPVRIKNPVQVTPSPNSSNQRATSSNQPVKIKNPVQVTPSPSSSNKLLNQLRQVKEQRQNQE